MQIIILKDMSLPSAPYSTTMGIALVVVQHLRYSKINNLRIHIRIQEDVAWFQIQMDNALLM